MPKRQQTSPTTGLPDLEPSRAAVLNSLGSANSRRAYDYGIRKFLDWYCGQPRLGFNRSVVAQYRSFLERRRLSASTINLRLGAVRRLASEAADNGPLSPELAAGIRRVKGVKNIGARIGNWLTAQQARDFLNSIDVSSLKGKRDFALAAVLLACGLGALNWQPSKFRISRKGTAIGSLLTLSEKAATFGPYRCLRGSKWQWINGRRQLR